MGHGSLVEGVVHASLDQSTGLDRVRAEAVFDAGPDPAPGGSTAWEAGKAGQLRLVGRDRPLSVVVEKQQDVGPELTSGHQGAAFVGEDVGGVELEGRGLAGARILLAFRRKSGIIHWFSSSPAPTRGDGIRTLWL